MIEADRNLHDAVGLVGYRDRQEPDRHAGRRAQMAGRMLDRIVVDGEIVVELFVAAMRTKDPVGICDCGGFLQGRIDRTRRITFYVGECGRCGYEVVAPGGRTARPVAGEVRRPAVLPVASEAEREAWRERDLAMLGERDD